MKHDGRYKSQVVAGGHLTETPAKSVYSGVVSLQGIRITVFLADLNNLEVWQTDVGNAYLKALTNNKGESLRHCWPQLHWTQRLHLDFERS